MGGVSFLFFFNRNFLYLLLVPLVGLQAWCGGLFCGEVRGVACRMHPFWGWITWSVLRVNVFGWFLSFPGLLSGQSAMSDT